MVSCPLQDVFSPKRCRKDSNSFLTATDILSFFADCHVFSILPISFCTWFGLGAKIKVNPMTKWNIGDYRKIQWHCLFLELANLRIKTRHESSEFRISGVSIRAVLVCHPFRALKKELHFLVVAPFRETTDNVNQLVWLIVFPCHSITGKSSSSGRHLPVNLYANNAFTLLLFAMQPFSTR